MPRPVSSIPNLGPASEAAFARAGIHSAEEIEALGPDAAYESFLRAGNPPHFIGYYVLVMGLQGRPWNDCQGEEKAALRRRFDAIKARVAARPSSAMIDAKLEAVLDEIGIRPRR
ncbi:TfoX/Sxy family protein [Defluviimonas sp. WL0075]|uniref:TfoX/Sxy family protein n=1 Tax=Albidovulum sediminicola TaxID=2984331 RepID=A0ABT2YZR7_9RHOB|nr:TfoX/Sxy family protein [Defluviimonas sp. WL0075]MCV2864295.1 TfoX/Sxy family protein [Defluviimonas sp. WL0075]